MPPKKSTTATKKAAGSDKASYLDMVKNAITSLKERNGSSRQAIQKYIRANNDVGTISDNMYKSLVNRAISTGEDKGEFTRPKGPSGPVKLAKKSTTPKKTEPKAEKATEKKVEEKKKPAAKKATTTKAKATTTTKKAAAPKKATKAAATKATTKKAAAPKKAAAKPKANASKPRKTAGAVTNEEPRILGKTKTGRIIKTTAPALPKATKKPAPKKAAAKKATPKKATPKKA